MNDIVTYQTIVQCCVTFVSYNPRSYYERVPELRQCIDMIASGYFSPEDSNLFRNIVSTLLDSDRYRPIVDFTCQDD